MNVNDVILTANNGEINATTKLNVVGINEIVFVENIAESDATTFIDTDVHQDAVFIEDADVLVDFSKICRCCLKECDNMHGIFSDNNSIASMMEAVSTVKVCLDIV